MPENHTENHKETTVENSTEQHKEQRAHIEPKKRLRIRPFDIVALVLIVTVIALLITTLAGKLALKHEVSAAQVIATQAIQDFHDQKVAAIADLGNKNFQTQFKAKNTASQLKQLAEIYTSESPALISQTVSNTSSAQDVVFVYEYTRLKLPFYIRVTVQKAKASTSWQLSQFSGGLDSTGLQSSN